MLLKIIKTIIPVGILLHSFLPIFVWRRIVLHSFNPEQLLQLSRILWFIFSKSYLASLSEFCISFSSFLKHLKLMDFSIFLRLHTSYNFILIYFKKSIWFYWCIIYMHVDKYYCITKFIKLFYLIFSVIRVLNMSNSGIFSIF